MMIYQWLTSRRLWKILVLYCLSKVSTYKHSTSKTASRWGKDLHFCHACPSCSPSEDHSRTWRPASWQRAMQVTPLGCGGSHHCPNHLGHCILLHSPLTFPSGLAHQGCCPLNWCWWCSGGDGGQGDGCWLPWQQGGGCPCWWVAGVAAWKAPLSGVQILCPRSLFATDRVEGAPGMPLSKECRLEWWIWQALSVPTSWQGSTFVMVFSALKPKVPSIWRCSLNQMVPFFIRRTQNWTGSCSIHIHTAKHCCAQNRIHIIWHTELLHI